MKTDALRSLGAAPSRHRNLLAFAWQETRKPGPTRLHLDLPFGEDVPAERRASGSSRVI
jgi:hypothetical protein